jgi:GMP synthase (glutamine-hydrolysing)
MKKVLIINNERDIDDIGWIPKIKEAISGIEEVEFVVIHHSEISEDTLAAINPDLIYLSGRVTHNWTITEIHEDYDSELKMLQNIEIPTLGVCAGHQLMALAYGADFGEMVNVKEGEESIREKGFKEMEIRKDSPLFRGLDTAFTCYQDHRDEVKSIPDEFELAASNETCNIQAIQHRSKKFYGVQFHPEQYTEAYSDGKILLENFLNLA